ncbi:hypothetical protein [Nocardioides montaniterrae]
MMAVLEHLFDDAAVFPPGNAALPDAVAAYVARRGGPLGALVGPLVVASHHLPDLGSSVGLDLAVVSGDLEVHLSGGGSQAYVELPFVAKRQQIGPGNCGLSPNRKSSEPPTWPTGLRAKVRLGPTPERCPSADTLAETLVDLAAARVRFKATAGLHAALPHDGLHGFLNLMVAAGAAWAGADLDEVRAVLTSHDAADLADRAVNGPDPRAMLTSIGTCSIDEPAAALVELGLLPEAVVR